VETVRPNDHPTSATKPNVPSERQQRLDALLQRESSLTTEVQQQIHRIFADDKMSPEQLKSFLDTVPVQSKTKNELWNIYYTYEPAR